MTETVNVNAGVNQLKTWHVASQFLVYRCHISSYLQTIDVHMNRRNVH